jgi:lysozyme
MDADTHDALLADLRRDEGHRDRPYQDSVGVWTVGYGHNLQGGPPLSARAQQQILDDDVAATLAFLDLHLPWWMTLSPIRQRVLANMAFNLGTRLLGFHGMLTAMRAGDVGAVMHEMLDSEWARQVGARADRLAEMWRTDAPLGT